MHNLSLTQRIDAILPQTQCTRCGYDACMPYAQAIATKGELINRCPPGGEAGIAALAALTGQPVIPLDPDCGSYSQHTVAVIDEEHCIGCTLCIQACPVDAIIGANKLMHTVLTDLCTGCDLCVAPCPVDCIEMVPTQREWSAELTQQAKSNYQRRQQRLSQKHDESEQVSARVLANKPKVSAQANSDSHRKAILDSILNKARARRQE